MLQTAPAMVLPKSATVTVLARPALVSDEAVVMAMDQVHPEPASL
jgi:hypothetical protein